MSKTISPPVTIYGTPYTKEFFEEYRAKKLYGGEDREFYSRKFRDLRDDLSDMWSATPAENEAKFLFRFERFLKDQL